jgi:LysR family transcriptional regulator for metE and metH
VPRIPFARPRLDIRDLQIALSLASAGSTAAAGASLHLTQSAVSRALLLAEEKLGTRIFDRSARGLLPTPEGERLLRGAGEVLAHLVELEHSVRSAGPVHARVRLVSECYTAYRWIPSALRALRARVPHLEVTLAVDHTRDPVAGLAAGEVDIALLTTSQVRTGIRERPLFSDEIVFVLSATHPLAGRPAITARDLREHSIVTGETPPAETGWFMSRVFGKRRPKLDFIRFPLTEAIIDATRAGMGIAVLSEWIASAYLDSGGLVVKRFAARPLRRPWRIAFRPDAAELARRLASVLDSSAPHLGSRA